MLKLTIVFLLALIAIQAMALDAYKIGNMQPGVDNMTLFAQDDLTVKSRKQATMMVKQGYDARVVSVVSVNANGVPGYRAKLLGKDGTVFYVFVNAKTGQMSRS